jgi:predicted negative regulator of RcsB-dependent stress response|tara:strand:+ start:68 stop:712 length:645 start_codon:yes stop_codon:yes gene_type:complete
MDEEITIIDTNTRNEKIKNFFINNKKNFIIGTSIIIIGLIVFFTFEKTNERNKIKLANKFNSITIDFKTDATQKTINELIDIINHNDATYSPLALFFLLDNNLMKNNIQTNKLFDELINKTNLEKEIKNLIIYKKALFNSNFVTENDLLKALNPIINSESVWKSHALYLLAEYFYSKNEDQKAKEFFNQILSLPNVNNEIKIESQKRINRDLSE